MSHSYVSSLYHIVFSTKNRLQVIEPIWEKRLWSYIGGIAKDNDMQLFAIGGIGNHLHLLLGIPSTIPICKAVQLLKGGSSLWIHSAFPLIKGFSWQIGYGAFSIGISQIKPTIQYIQNQKEHHETISYEKEFISFLKKNRVFYDEQSIWE